MYTFYFLIILLDPVVASLAQDIFKELAQIEPCQGPMQMRLIPTLVSIMQAPPDKIPSGLCAVRNNFFVFCLFCWIISMLFNHWLITLLEQTAIDILTTVVRNTKPPLSEMLVCQAFPAVAQCTLNADDNATMQVNGRINKSFLKGWHGWW